MARPEGFEPPTLWSEATCSSPLSYGRTPVKGSGRGRRAKSAQKDGLMWHRPGPPPWPLGSPRLRDHP